MSEPAAATPDDEPRTPRSSVDAAFDALIADASREPWRHDLWQLLRTIDAKHAGMPRLGRAPKPDLEPLRIGQEPSLAFAPAQLHALAPPRDGARMRLTILGFGLFGPNGPLPLHLTEFARERMRSFADRTFVRFADMLHHRFTLLFYRAWADGQPTASLDRPGDDRFSGYVGSLSGRGDPSQRGRDDVADHAKLYFSGHLVRQARNAEGLERILSTYFGVGVTVEPWTWRWLPLARDQQSRLGGNRDAERLGLGTVAGERVPDVQSSFRVRVGPLALAQYEDHLPGGRGFAQMLAWLRNYIGYEFAWDVRLVLRRDSVPRAAIGGAMRLGWTTWLGQRAQPRDADDLVLVHETIAARPAARAAAPAT